MIRLYKSLVRPLVEYCTPAWSPYYQKDKALLEKIQHRFTRLVPGLKDLPYIESLRSLDLWSLEERRHRADLIEVFKMFKGVSGIEFADMFQLSHNDRTRGHSFETAEKPLSIGPS